jgi:hopene-associated glycosyltransferase HpnB
LNGLILAAALVSTTSFLAWVWLVLARGMFWRTDVQLPPPSSQREDIRNPNVWPGVSIVVPARDEAAILPETLPTLLEQDYPGELHVFLVDDQSRDGTADTAQRLARESGATDRMTLVSAEPPDPGWTGKLSALQQGIQAGQGTQSEYVLISDADIAHPEDSLRSLVTQAHNYRMDMVSLMARLRVENAWERLLIPAFVFFFAKLYPFRWSNNPRSSTAAAAGGCVLVRRDSLESSGGLEAIAGELIDDCALAARIKHHVRQEGGRIWLGFSRDVRSLRAYEGLAPVWRMVARTAYSQLGFSRLLLVGTVLGMLFLYLIPPVAAIGGLVVVSLDPEALASWLAVSGVAAYSLMMSSYVPMLRWHRTSPLWAHALPVTALLYTMMTVDSARRWSRGEGSAWKGRAFDGTVAKDARPD